ncbi:MAG: DUF5662 family protein [Eubacterium sp.]
MAWMHHKGRNKHHYEFWVDYNLETKRNEPVEMPYNYVADVLRQITAKFIMESNILTGLR